MTPGPQSTHVHDGSAYGLCTLISMSQNRNLLHRATHRRWDLGNMGTEPFNLKTMPHRTTWHRAKLAQVSKISPCRSVLTAAAATLAISLDSCDVVDAKDTYTIKPCYTVWAQLTTNAKGTHTNLQMVSSVYTHVLGL